MWYSWRNSLISIRTAELLTYPRVDDLFNIPEFIALHDNTPPCTPITNEMFQHIVNDFPNIVQRFIEKSKRDYTVMVPKANFRERSPVPLELATSVFLEPTIRDLPASFSLVHVGWKMLSTRHYSNYGTVSRDKAKTMLCSFDDALSQTARMLVEDLCKLDPYTTTVEDMDKLDERFYCEICQEKAQVECDWGGRWRVDAYSWRAVVCFICLMIA